MKRTLTTIIGLLSLVAGLVVIGNAGQAADHLDAPLVQADGRTDINDVYLFQSPDDPDNVVMIATVNPLAGVQSPTTFDKESTIRFFFDTDGDARADEHIRATFSGINRQGDQYINIAGSAGKGRGFVGDTISLPGGGRATAGVYDDPFFFDFQAFLDQVKGSGGSRTFCDGDEVDFFAGLNATAIAIEVPASVVTNGSTMTGMFVGTKTDAGRIDRMGRPAINTVLIFDNNEDRFNKRLPHVDPVKHRGQVVDNLLFLSGLDGSGYTRTEAEGVADILLPDVLTFDTSSTDGFLNGRQLADDVIDAELAIVTGSEGANGSPVLTSDCVDANDVPFSNSFPWLAPAH